MHGKWEKQYWGLHVKQRIARQIDYIKHWKVVNCDASGIMSSFKDEATWFIDPPYQVSGGHRYVCAASDIDFVSLSQLVYALSGQVIVCEGAGAWWLPFEHLLHGRNTNGRQFQELVYRQGC